LHISEEETLKRLLKRAGIEGRSDDNPESIKKRLSLYHTRTEKLIADMQGEVKEIKVDGERSVEEIAKDLERIVNDQIKNS
jgi:adenylate kinase